MRKYKRIGSLIGLTLLAGGAVAAIALTATSCNNKKDPPTPESIVTWNKLSIGATIKKIKFNSDNVTSDRGSLQMTGVSIYYSDDKFCADDGILSPPFCMFNSITNMWNGDTRDSGAFSWAPATYTLTIVAGEIANKLGDYLEGGILTSAEFYLI